MTVPFETPAFTISASPSSGIVYGTTTYTLTLTTPLVTALSAGELIGIKFPPHFINKYQANLNTDLNTYVFADSDTIFIEWSASSTLTFTTISNPDYQMLDLGTYVVQLSILDTFRSIRASSTAKLPSTFKISPHSSFSYLHCETLNSISGGDTNVTYSFSFILGHYIPENGAISILFPSDLFTNLVTLGISCYGSGGDLSKEFNNSHCEVTDKDRIDLILVSTLLDQLAKY